MQNPKITIARIPLKGVRSDPALLHKAVATAVGDNRAKRDPSQPSVLWRVDPSLEGGANLLVQSPRPFELMELCGLIGYVRVPDGAIMRDDYGERIASFEKGMRLRYRLVACPSAMKRGERARRPHISPIHQAAWLVGQDAFIGNEGAEAKHFGQKQGKETSCGFRTIRGLVGRPELLVRESQTFDFNHDRVGHERERVKYVQTTFDGALEVTDADAFQRALACGIGHVKAFGNGLMTVAEI